MFTRVVILAALAVLAAAPLRAQRRLRPSRRAGIRQICGEDVPPPASLPPADSGPVVYQIAPCFDAQGGTSVIEPETYLYYMQLKPQPPVPERLEAVGRSGRESRPRRLPPALGHELPRQPLDRGAGLQVLQRRRRQAHHVPHGRAAARQDRRLRRLEANRDVEDRRAAEGSDGGDPPRHVHRSRARAQGVGASSATCSRTRASRTPRSRPKS